MAIGGFVLSRGGWSKLDLPEIRIPGLVTTTNVVWITNVVTIYDTEHLKPESPHGWQFFGNYATNYDNPNVILWTYSTNFHK